VLSEETKTIEETVEEALCIAHAFGEEIRTNCGETATRSVYALPYVSATDAPLPHVGYSCVRTHRTSDNTSRHLTSPPVAYPLAGRW